MANENSHTGRTIAIVLAVMAGGFAAYYFHTHTKRYYAQIIIKLNGASDFSGLMQMQETFLHAWSRELAIGNPVFVFAGNHYHTQGGTRVV